MYFHILIQLSKKLIGHFNMFGLVPEEQVEWTKEPIAHKADQSLLRNKLIKLNLLNNKHIFLTPLVLLLVY